MKRHPIIILCFALLAADMKQRCVAGDFTDAFLQSLFGDSVRDNVRKLDEVIDRLIIESAKQGKLIRFDSGLVVECLDVSPEAFVQKNPDFRIFEARFCISANFLQLSPREVGYINYHLHLPSTVDLKDYIPRTQLDTDVVGQIDSKRSVSSKSGLVIAFEGGAKVNYHIPFVGEAGVNRGGSRQTSKSEEFSTDVEMKLLPPKQTVITSGTEDRRQTVYFKLAPFSQTTLEGEKVFVCLFAAPKNWAGDCAALTCEFELNYNKDKKRLMSSPIVIGLYPSGNAEAKMKIEAMAKAGPSGSESKAP